MLGRTGKGCTEKEAAIDSPRWIAGKTVYALPGLPAVAVIWPLVSLVPAAILGGRGTVAGISGGVLLVAAVTVVAMRTARMAVIVDESGVTVRSAWRTWRCSWTEVRGFQVPGSPLFPVPVPRMVCDSGRRIRLSALMVGRGGLVWFSGGLVGQDWVEEQVALLNQEVREHRPRSS